jgi:hypothetical protein
MRFKNSFDDWRPNQRRIKGPVMENVTQVKHDPEEQPAPVKDPATWYGAFVVPALRDAQGSFISAVELVNRLVILQSQLGNIENQIQTLKKATR